MGLVLTANVLRNDAGGEPVLRGVLAGGMG